MADHIFVTGRLNVVPGSLHAEEVCQAFASACKEDKTTSIYVLGSLFDPDVSKDDMLVYLERLPGDKHLVADALTPRAEKDAPGWTEVCNRAVLVRWGRTFTLMAETSDQEQPGLLVHASDWLETDNAKHIRSAWEDWHDRFGPGGLNSLYALGVLADQYAAGLIAEEPA